MANDVYATIRFTGKRIKQFKKDLKSLIKDDSHFKGNKIIEMDDLYKFYNIPEIDQERFYIEDFDLTEKDSVTFETWNAWNPKIEAWHDIAEYYEDDETDPLDVYCFAYDGDHPYHVVNTDYEGKYFSSRYKVMYKEFDDDTAVFDEYDYYSTLDECMEFVKDFEESSYCIFKIWDEVENFMDEPEFYDKNGDLVSAPDNYF